MILLRHPELHPRVVVRVAVVVPGTVRGAHGKAAALLPVVVGAGRNGVRKGEEKLVADNAVHPDAVQLRGQHRPVLGHHGQRTGREGSVPGHRDVPATRIRRRIVEKERCHRVESRGDEPGTRLAGSGTK
jgi:hypothetical protein